MSSPVYPRVKHRYGSALALCAIVASVAMIAAAGASAATFPGTNGLIAFANSPGTGSTSDIFTIDPSGAGRLQLTTDPGDDGDPSWSGDGERIAFDRFPTGGFGSILVMNYNGTGQQPLTPGTSTADDCCPSFSPNGKTIAFERYDGSFSRIWRINADGSGATPLTDNQAGNQNELDPEYSPDGTKIAFTRFNNVTGAAQIWIMNADGSGQQLVYAPSAPNDFVSQPAFSPNGQRLIFEQLVAGHLDIATVGVDGTNPTPLITTPDEESGPKFSPDGTKIAFTRSPAAGGSSAIIVADANGANQQPLASSFNFSPDWQPLNPPSCDISGNKKSKSVKQVTVTVTCANENATATISGTGKVPKAARGATVSKKKLKIPPVTVQIPEGTPTNVTLKIPKKGKKLLKKATKAGKKAKATISASLTSDLGESSSDTFKVSFKAKKK